MLVYFCMSTHTLMLLFSRRKREAHEHARAAFHVFRGRAVVKDDEGVGALEKVPRDPQPHFHLVLLADHDEHSRVHLAEPLEGLVVRESRQINTM